MYHYPLIFLNEGKNSTAVYSYTVPETLIIFVHGFTGEAMETWNDFEYFLRNDDDFISADIILYGYESLKGQINDQAMEFFRFLDHTATSRATYPTYKKVIIMAHSQGAIVTRYALLEAINRHRGWRGRCKLLLFAPAHKGARIQNLVFASLPGFYKIVAGLGLYHIPVLDDLRPESPVIRELDRITESYRGSSEEALLKANVLQAFGDKVVHNIPFCFDNIETESPIRGKNHKTVCKPKVTTYITPLEILKRHI